MDTTRNDAEGVETIIDENTPHKFSSPWHFSDVVLDVEGTKFHVHRSTLSMWSPVFQTMFTSQFLERTANEIPLPGKRANEVEQLLKVIYSDDAKQEVKKTNYEFLLELAREYQMDKVLQHCGQYMKQGTNKRNCLHRYKIAERFGFEDVMEKCNEEARFKPSYELEGSADFNDLGFESKFKLCMARIKELEKALTKYVYTCSDLVSDA
ncbi:actin-binding protein IPP-like [Actinia tenebrosa]|uniref:Actin-binding protein IPP-like n=1 Tax=Actinia tenebrosa TaxID=6105 RepID=A0A6P8IHV7_ACTTE|nr:actin-binding protein IPP-like [Actinia tenebrosa]